MGLFKRIPYNRFVNTGQTGQFVSSCTFPVFGINPREQKSGEMILSNSCYPSGATQLSFFVCSQETEGFNFNGNQNLSTACFCINLFKDYTNQAWLIKNSLIGIGQHSNGNKDQYYSADLIAFVYSDSGSPYKIRGPFNNVYTKSQNSFCSIIEAAPSGIVLKVCDSPDTRMKWTNKIEIIQSINQEELNILTDELQILDYFNISQSPQDSATNIQVYNLGDQIPTINAGEEDGDPYPVDIFDGGLDI
jgi:hypothetical protein